MLKELKLITIYIHEFETEKWENGSYLFVPNSSPNGFSPFITDYAHENIKRNRWRFNSYPVAFNLYDDRFLTKGWIVSDFGGSYRKDEIMNRIRKGDFLVEREKSVVLKFNRIW